MNDKDIRDCITNLDEIIINLHTDRICTNRTIIDNMTPGHVLFLITDARNLLTRLMEGEENGSE